MGSTQLGCSQKWFVQPTHFPKTGVPHVGATLWVGWLSKLPKWDFLMQTQPRGLVNRFVVCLLMSVCTVLVAAWGLFWFMLCMVGWLFSRSQSIMLVATILCRIIGLSVTVKQCCIMSFSFSATFSFSVFVCLFVCLFIYLFVIPPFS